jgi:hypothetical protein
METPPKRDNEARQGRSWGCIIGVLGEVLAIVAGIYSGARMLSPGNPHNDPFGRGWGEALLCLSAFAFGWPVLWLLGPVAWRSVNAIDARLNRSDDLEQRENPS